MRRLALLTLVLVAATALTVSAGGKRKTYRVDAIFDNTASLIPGQDVKIAGARVGSVRDVTLTRDRRARVEMEVEPGFAPFRSDAQCTIRPQSLIGEKFVECDPGTPQGRELRGSGGHAPTVPLVRNHSPVDLDLIFATFRQPYRERLRLIIDELGTGLAGRSGDLNAAILRANPALQETRRVLGILDRDRRTLQRLVSRSDQVIGELARRRTDVAQFIERAEAVSAATASRRAELDSSIRYLPPLLDELEPSARELAAFSHDARPTVRSLRAAAPGLNALLGDLGPLSDATRPALRKLSTTARIGRRAVASARPVARMLRAVAHALPPIVRLATALNESLRATGAVEGLQSFVYFGSAATARFDRYSHILPSYQIAGTCQQYATAPVAGCSAHFGRVMGARAGQPVPQPARDLQRPQSERPRRRARPRPRRDEEAPAGRAPERPRLPQQEVPRLPRLPRIPPLNPLLDYLLGA